MNTSVSPEPETTQPTDADILQQHLAEQAAADREQRRIAELNAAARVDVRLQALDRLRLMSVYFAGHAWRFRNADPLAPHCLAFLFVHRDPSRPGMWLVTAAWRGWIEEPDVRSLPHLLNDLNKQWAYGACGDGFDIRTELADGCDEQPSGTPVVYAGLGVISLDTPAGTWEQARGRARGPADIAAELRILLTDKTVMVAQRLGRNDFDEYRISSSQPLERGWLRPAHPHTTVDLEQLHDDPRHRHVLRWAQELSDTLSQADTHRLDAQQRHTPRRPGHRA